MTAAPWRKLAKDLTPPVFVMGARRLARARRREPPEWEYVAEGWARGRTGPELRGWTDPTVLDAYRTKLPLDGPGPLAFSTSAASAVGAANVSDQNTLLAFAYALSRASRGADRVSVLDWGGGVGFFSFVARTLLPETVELEYHCKDLPEICAAGRDMVPEITFWDDDTCLARRYDLVFASSSLQYSEAWATDLTGLVEATKGCLFLTRVPVVFEHPSFVVLQRTLGYRFDTEYLSWIFNERELLDRASAAGAELEREFLLGGRADVVGAPEPNQTRGYLFRHNA